MEGESGGPSTPENGRLLLVGTEVPTLFSFPLARDSGERDGMAEMGERYLHLRVVYCFQSFPQQSKILSLACIVPS